MVIKQQPEYFTIVVGLKYHIGVAGFMSVRKLQLILITNYICKELNSIGRWE